MRLTLAGAALMLTALAWPHVVGAQVAPGVAVSGELWFDAKATLGAFRGVTRTFRGAIAGGAHLGEVRGWLEFNAAELATGNGLRDRDMRGSLEVERYPLIRFDLDSVGVAPGQEARPDSISAELIGRMQIHGVTRSIRVMSVVRRSGELIRVSGSFDLFVPDYRIGGLRKMLGMLSMEETVRVGFDVTFNTTPQGEEG